jgi:hypothetical protein|tara:strand:- start:395 stop:1096 length:702 start_codon:yes stop_codon:yes gene_type:complete
LKIYTYHNDVGFPLQDELIKLWSRSWSKWGFEPIVLNLHNAESHPYFKEFFKQIVGIHNNIMPNVPPKSIGYNISCHMRWLAYASKIDNEYCLFSDYDVININLDSTNAIIDGLKTNNIHFLDSCCPCIALGKTGFCEQFCKDIINLSLQNIRDKDVSTESYHDQSFIVHNKQTLKNKYKFSKDNELWKHIKHFSHHSMSAETKKIRKNNPKLNYHQVVNNIRVKQITKELGL